MSRYAIRQATIVNEGKIFIGDVWIEGERVVRIDGSPCSVNDTSRTTHPEPRTSHRDLVEIDARGLYLLPGIIDDQVHFREPGLTHKGDIFSESRAAVAGGITSFMEMPNTNPKTVTDELLRQKWHLAADHSLANYSFFFGATNDNINEIQKIDPSKVCGVKVFLGASTGNMLVDDNQALEAIFRESPVLVAVHSEDEGIIRENTRLFKDIHGENVPITAHPLIRSAEACYRSTERAVSLARKVGARLHVLHLSTGKELALLDRGMPLIEKRVTGEVCIHHLWFNDQDYERLGAKIKWNPAIKSRADQEALLQGLLDDTIDIIATDHAPHLWEEKQNPYFSSPSGGPLVQHALVAMLEFHRQGKLSLETLVQKMAHNVASLYRVENRGFIREGYYADLVLVNLNAPWTVTPDTLLYKCGWSPFEGVTFGSSILSTWVNGNLVYDQGRVNDRVRGRQLRFY